jgi:hypothetical protein
MDKFVFNMQQYGSRYIQLIIHWYKGNAFVNRALYSTVPGEKKRRQLLEMRVHLD